MACSNVIMAMGTKCKKLFSFEWNNHSRKKHKEAMVNEIVMQLMIIMVGPYRFFLPSMRAITVIMTAVAHSVTATAIKNLYLSKDSVYEAVSRLTVDLSRVDGPRPFESGDLCEFWE